MSAIKWNVIKLKKFLHSKSIKRKENLQSGRKYLHMIWQIRDIKYINGSYNATSKNQTMCLKNGQKN